MEKKKKDAKRSGRSIAAKLPGFYSQEDITFFIIQTKNARNPHTRPTWDDDDTKGTLNNAKNGMKLDL